ncbi:hypothetical protein [Dictyobacter kobayashii]|uniref:PBP domain-containing protein n=1 Tax=Dictyobacter kobayashii TaxID=2014872 RepID=A0A402APT0_9CHLR|nr:hypothetical protein [Dictyobacter kobayashii]GCE21173.1 hypothetical protein KDK_49730 [Dictyobacter kobayashii]
MLGPGLILRPDIIAVDTTDNVVTQVQQTAGSIGYVDLKTAQDHIAESQFKIIKIDNAEASLDNIKTDRYRFWAVEYMYTPKDSSALATSFVSYVKKKVKDEKYYLSYDDVPASILRKHL